MSPIIEKCQGMRHRGPGDNWTYPPRHAEVRARLKIDPALASNAGGG
ncbi:MAG: hypothetical protein WDZ51_10005 [Pirellulaceae bacterium]